MYLHLIDDTSQINHLIRRSNIMFPGKHLFYALSKNGKLENVIDEKNVIAIKHTKENILKITQELSGFKAVFIHNLCYTKSKIILHSPKNIRFLWGVWGFDYYYVYPELFKKVFLPNTKFVNFLLFKHSLPAKYLLHGIHPVTKYIGIKSRDRIRQQAAKRIEFTINNMREFSELFRVVDIPKKNRFNGIYYSIEYITKEINKTDFTLGNNIYIGNSASNSSNHLDIFSQLKKLNLSNRKIIVPLSYGCSRYRFFVNFSGKQIFKDKFEPLLKFLSIDEYNKILLNCNVQIYNHRRAQAIGNILFGIWAGHKVFLRKCNPVYNYLKSLNIEVCSIEEDLSVENISTLEKDKQIKNREIIMQHYSEKQIQKNYSEIIETIEN